MCDVLDKHLEGKQYMVNDEYSIADMVSPTPSSSSSLLSSTLSSLSPSSLLLLL
jgi:glutathione S-transferase